MGIFDLPLTAAETIEAPDCTSAIGQSCWKVGRKAVVRVLRQDVYPLSGEGPQRWRVMTTVLPIQVDCEYYPPE